MQNTLNICKQRSPLCGGEHVDVEFSIYGELTDSQGMGPIVETVYRKSDENAKMFWYRVDKLASKIDRQLSCPKCYK